MIVFRSSWCLSAVRAFRSGLSLTCVGDILTHNAFAQIPLLLPLPSAPELSHAWPTHSAFSSMILALSSPTFLSPTHSPSPTSLRAGTLASPQAARPSPISRGAAATFMSRPRMALRFPFSGGVRSRAIIFSTSAHLHHLSSCRNRHPVVWQRCGACHV